MAGAHLFTQAYGGEAIRDQALYLAWSALAWRGSPALRVHVYTDDPAPYAPLAAQVEVRRMSPEEIRSWRGRHDFTHRLKARLVQDVARRFPNEPLLYLDADTFLIRPPEEALARLGPGRAVMHVRESHLLDPADGHNRNFSRRLGRLAFRGAPIDLDRWMWNAGAIGLDPSMTAVVDDWIAFIDEVWPRYRRGLVEQYGIAMLLQQAGELSACDDVVIHYWSQKEEFTAVLRGKLEELRGQPLEKALEHLRQHPIRIPLRPQPKVSIPFWRKWRRSLLGER